MISNFVIGVIYILTVLWVGLQCVIVAISGDAHLLSDKKYINAIIGRRCFVVYK